MSHSGDGPDRDHPGSYREPDPRNGSNGSAGEDGRGAEAYSFPALSALTADRPMRYEQLTPPPSAPPRPAPLPATEPPSIPRPEDLLVRADSALTGEPARRGWRGRINR